MKQLKIVTIGGGSSYTPELIEGFIKRKDELNIKEIWLVDIKEGEDKLNIVGELSRRMIKKAGLDWEVYLTLDLSSALKDADFVTTQFRVGLLEARIKDEMIPLSHGIIGQETNGVGGIFKALRTIPVILDIIKQIKELCPKAWLINFTNPAGMVTEAAINKGLHERTIGLCNVPIVHMNICNTLENHEAFSEELYFKFAGLNHFHWHRVWNKDGLEITDSIIDKMYGKDVLNSFIGVKNIPQIPLDFDLIKAQGLLPCMYHRYYYISQVMLDLELDEYNKGETRAQVVKATETRLFELYKDVELDYKPEELTNRGGTFYSDAACECIASIVNDKRKLMVVSTKNKGAIKDLAYDDIVEVSSYITSHGPEPVTWGGFDYGIKGMLQLQKNMELCSVEAAVSGDYQKLKEAFLINPIIPNNEAALLVLDEMLLAHEKHLPQFKEIISIKKEVL